MPDSAQEKKQLTSDQMKRLRIIAMIALAVILVGAILLCSFSIRNENLRDRFAFAYAGNTFNDGVYPITMDAEAQKQEVKKIKRRGQTGKFAYYSASVVRMQSYMAEGAIYFGSVSTNKCALVFTICDENGALLYRSVGVNPGYYVHSIRLADPKENGVYPCRMYVTAYDAQTNEYIGTQYSDLTLVIGG